jgi:hypothetical protein
MIGITVPASFQFPNSVVPSGMNFNVKKRSSYQPSREANVSQAAFVIEA